jgi:hypothetical protein
MHPQPHPRTVGYIQHGQDAIRDSSESEMPAVLHYTTSRLNKDSCRTDRARHVLKSAASFIVSSRSHRMTHRTAGSLLPSTRSPRYIYPLGDQHKILNQSSANTKCQSVQASSANINQP